MSNPTQKVSPLNWNTPIVNADGTPSSQFLRLWQQMFGNDENYGDEIKALQDAALKSGTGIKIDPDGHLLSNPTISADLQAMLDAISNKRGSLLYRGATGWTSLPPGDDGYFLQTNGAGQDPEWAAATANIQTLLDSISSTQGVILYRSASAWVALSPGTSGYFLQTQGAGANPQWAAGGGSGGAWTLLGSRDFAVTPASTFEVNVSGYTEILCNGLNLVHAASVQRCVQLSVTGGTSWFTTSGDYADVAATGIPTNNAAIFGHNTAATAARSFVVQILGNVGIIPLEILCPTRAVQQQFGASSTAINRVRLMGSVGGSGTPSASNFTAGTFQVLGR